MPPAPSPLLTLEAARELQRCLRAEIGPGLGEGELDDVEARFGFRFAADHRTFLAAGLPYGEHGRAPELFDRVLGELGLAAGLPGEDTGPRWEAARWELVHWWLRLIVNGSTAPATGTEVIAHGGWGALGRPRALWPLVTLDTGCDGPAGERIRTFGELGAAIVAEAERLLAGPWPPHGPR
ncbi:hypothetical protein ACFWXO_33240 [Kitasatospora sp. NPDC059088]|uniref:hypothetical protein n=1 Tax=Kitasatospora sp. NPDC059088 TaxID=3346722 RepID=UPI00368C9A1B